MKCIYPLILLETLSVVILGYILLILEFRVHLHLYWHSFYLTIQMLMVQAVDWMRRVQSPNCKGAEREGRAPCIKLVAANVFTNFGVKFWQTTTLIQVVSHFAELLLGTALGFFIVVVECTEVQIIETWGETKSGAESARERRARDAKLLDED